MIDVKETISCNHKMHNVSSDIQEQAHRNLSKGRNIVLAGDWVYEVLTGENESEVIKGSELEFRRCPKLNNCDALILDLNTFKAVKVEDYDL